MRNYIGRVCGSWKKMTYFHLKKGSTYYAESIQDNTEPVIPESQVNSIILTIVVSVRTSLPDFLSNEISQSAECAFAKCSGLIVSVLGVANRDDSEKHRAVNQNQVLIWYAINKQNTTAYIVSRLILTYLKW